MEIPRADEESGKIRSCSQIWEEIVLRRVTVSYLSAPFLFPAHQFTTNYVELGFGEFGPKRQ